MPVCRRSDGDLTSATTKVTSSRKRRPHFRTGQRRPSLRTRIRFTPSSYERSRGSVAGASLKRREACNADASPNTASVRAPSAHAAPQARTVSDTENARHSRSVEHGELDFARRGVGAACCDRNLHGSARVRYIRKARRAIDVAVDRDRAELLHLANHLGHDTSNRLRRSGRRLATSLPRPSAISCRAHHTRERCEPRAILGDQGIIN